MTQQEIEAVVDLAQTVANRASGFAGRGSAIFNGAIVADELLNVAVAIRGLAPEFLKDVTPRKPTPALLSNGDL